MTTTINPSFTNEEIRNAILRAAKTRPVNISAGDSETYVAPYEVQALRDVLSQLFPELPDEPGSVIQNVTSDQGRTFRVMTLDRAGEWVGVEDGLHVFECLRPERIVSWEPFEND